MTSVDYSGLTKVAPMKSALRVKKKSSGRNNLGRITVRHQGGGARRLYRAVDFKQLDKMGVAGMVEAVEYDPNRSAFIMKVLYGDGDRRYVLAPVNIEIGANVVTAEKTSLEAGNRMELRNIPVGYFVHNIEMNPRAGGRIVRSAGSQAQVLAHEGGYTNLKLPSGETRKVLSINFTCTNPGSFLPCCQNFKNGLIFAKLCRKSNITSGDNVNNRIPIASKVFLLTGGL